MNNDKSNKLIAIILVFLVLLCSLALFFDLYLPSFDSLLDFKKSSEIVNSKKVFININTATIDELVTLPKIGEVIANRIIEYRTINGPFKTKEDILKVNGIGNSIFSEIKDYIEVS